MAALIQRKLDCKGWRLVVTGHSLGAGAAALIAMHLYGRFPSAPCSFAGSAVYQHLFALFIQSNLHFKPCAYVDEEGGPDTLRDHFLHPASACALVSCFQTVEVSTAGLLRLDALPACY